MAPAQRPIGFWLKLLDAKFDEQFAATLEEHGVTGRQWQLMNVLDLGAAPLTELNRAVAPFLDEGSAESSAEHLEELVESEWVRIEVDSYALTEQGQTAFGRLREVVTRTRGTVADGISSAEYEQTLDVLERMARNLGWTEDEAPPTS
ncbi:MAG: MarR family winged helix-turn-helix transcriptional regulator [Propionibacteriaceae bacterium]